MYQARGLVVYNTHIIILSRFCGVFALTLKWLCSSFALVLG